jgi:hypothetical protein
LDDPAVGSAKVADNLKRLKEGIAKTRKCESAKVRKMMGYEMKRWRCRSLENAEGSSRGSKRMSADDLRRREAGVSRL